MALMTTALTGACFAISFALAQAAGDNRYPRHVLELLGEHLNADVKVVHESQTAPAVGLQTIEIDTKSTGIELTSYGGDVVTIDLSGPSRTDHPLSVETRGDTLIISVKGGSKMVWNFDDDDDSESKSPNLNVSTSSLVLKVQVPIAFSQTIKLNAKSGDINATALNLGELIVKTGSGNIQVEKSTTKQLSTFAGSGDISLSGNHQFLTAQVGSGDIRAKTISGDRLEMKTGSGDISLAELSARSVDVKTGSGNVDARLGKLENWTASAKTGHGDISSELAAGNQDNNDHQLELGSGPDRLSISTGSGDISVNL